jgi:formylglycine-generating enzyme required for sulfatase activity
MNAILVVKSRWRVVLIVAAVVGLAATETSPAEPDKAAPPAADSMLGKKAGDVRDDNALKMKLLWCPPGFLTMEQVDRIEEPAEKDDDANEDDPNEKPARKTRTVEKITSVKVSVTRGYWLGKFEVTQSEWTQVMATVPWGDFQNLMPGGDDFPARGITWNDAMTFCRTLTERERKADRLPAGWEYTLPTEAQWERACRAGTESNFSFGDDELELYEYAWFAENAKKVREYDHSVGQKKPNPWGLHDMHGNVSEWCRDWYVSKLPGGRDPEVVNKNLYRVARGGSSVSSAEGCRSALRHPTDPSTRFSWMGLRVALSAVRQAQADAPGTIDK